MKPVDPGLLETLTAALAAQPENLALRLHVVELLVAGERLDDALKTLRTGTSETEADRTYRRQLLVLLRRTGSAAEALIRAEAWLAESDDAIMRCELARALLARGDRQGAVDQYQAALATDATVRDPQFDDLSDVYGGSGTEMSLDDITAGFETDDDTQDDDEDEEEDEEEFRAPIQAENQTDDELEDMQEWETELVTFADVAGLANVKRQINLRIIAPFQKEDIYKAFGRKAGGGLLLYGPPGCGKTYIARATAGEIGATFINVGINEVLDRYWGESERVIHSLFASARRKAPAVLFFDEFDALGASRGRSDSQFFRTLVTQLLQEMDGLQGRPANVLTIAATNLPWNVDPAFRRPGRFDRVLFVPTPDVEARREMLKMLTTQLPGGDQLDLDTLAARTEGMTGADLGSLCERAAERSLEASLESGSVVPVTAEDLERSLKVTDHTASEWLSTARNYARYSNAAGQYDELVSFLKRTKQW